MGISTREHIVKYEDYCDHCKFKDNPDDSITCNDCLSSPAVIDSKKPTGYVPTKEWVQKEKCRKERLRLASRSRLKREV